jgi:hypothetical protein
VFVAPSLQHSVHGYKPCFDVMTGGFAPDIKYTGLDLISQAVDAFLFTHNIQKGGGFAWCRRSRMQIRCAVCSWSLLNMFFENACIGYHSTCGVVCRVLQDSNKQQRPLVVHRTNILTYQHANNCCRLCILTRVLLLLPHPFPSPSFLSVFAGCAAAVQSASGPNGRTAAAAGRAPCQHANMQTCAAKHAL